MSKKMFKSESKKLLNLMIHSIYTNKDIFLRELISNASDAIDKLVFTSLTDKSFKVNKKSLAINISFDKDKNTITISDNGIGMNEKELDDNLGSIAKSGSEAFKESLDKGSKNIDIIGQFGVGFYSAFMVADKIEVRTKKIDSDKAYLWKSSGEDGYSIEECDKDTNGTEITLFIKKNTEEVKYSEYLDENKLKELIKKYSDYIRYPIIINNETINTMIPLWKKNKKDVTEEEYTNFYMDRFNDYEKPLKVITSSVEGDATYKALMFIPKKAPFDYYSKDYEKGLALYSSGVLIMDKCSELLPDYFSFVKGIVDSEDVPLNLSRETLQKSYSVRVIAKSIESKIKKELEDMLKNDKETYKEFFKVFGSNLKYGVYDNFGANKDKLKDLLMFYSSTNKDLITLDEYVKKMPEDQENIYYASGESIEKIDSMPQIDILKDKKYDCLYLTDYVDEFALTAISEYSGKKFINALSNNFDLSSKEEKDTLEKENNDSKEMLDEMKNIIGDVSEVKFTNKLKDHAVCLESSGDISIEMEKVFKAMGNMPINANKVLEINKDHKIVDKLKETYKSNKEEFNKLTKILYTEAAIVAGVNITNPTEISDLIIDVIAK